MIAWGAGGVAKIVSPQVVVLLAGAADRGGLAGEAAGGALIALLGQDVKVALKARTPRAVGVKLSEVG